MPRYYDADKNPTGAAFDGVPLGDMDDATFDALPGWLQASVDASPMYRKTPVPAPKKAPTSDAPPAEGKE